MDILTSGQGMKEHKLYGYELSGNNISKIEFFKGILLNPQLVLFHTTYLN